MKTYYVNVVEVQKTTATYAVMAENEVEATQLVGLCGELVEAHTELDYMQVAVKP